MCNTTYLHLKGGLSPDEETPCDDSKHTVQDYDSLVAEQVRDQEDKSYLHQVSIGSSGEDGFYVLRSHINTLDTERSQKETNH